MSLRELAAQDPHSKPLSRVDESWFEGRDIRETDGAITVMRDQPCPVDKEARARYQYVAADQARDVRKPLADAVLLGCEMAEEIRSPKVWAWVPDVKSAEYLLRFLDRMAQEGGCERIEHEDYPGPFYVGTVTQVRRWANRV